MSSFHGPDLGPFQWDDPLLLEAQLTEDERMIRDTARDFAAKELAPRVQKAYLEEKTDPELFRLMGKSGLLGVTLPEEFGCAGAGYVSYGLVAREVERVDSGFRSMMSVQSSLVMYPIHAYGDSDQHQKYLPGLARGELIGCFGLTEPNAGSDPGGMVTRAEKIDGGYRLTGAKTWISNAPIADVFVVWAKSRAHGDQDSRLHPRKRHEGSLRAEDRGQAEPARLGHRRDRARQCRSAGECALAECLRPEGTVRLPEPRALRHILGRDGRGGGLLASAPVNTALTASSSAGRSLRPSSSRKSSPTCRPGSRSGFRRRSGSGG